MPAELPAGEPRRIAMWSGPRNISTALMRSWGNRPDTEVRDEPLYAHYLKVTGLPHPGAAEVLRRHETDWRRVVDELRAPLGPGKSILYQKQMAHHLLPQVGRGWLDGMRHAFLIRDPHEMLTSLIRQIPRPSLQDTGLPQQVEIFDRVARREGRRPPVVDARDVLQHPERTLRALCRQLDVPFLEAMLSWPPGPRDSDGAWAPHWYAAVERSTGFQPWRPKRDVLPAALRPLLAACQEPYRYLHQRRLEWKTGTDSFRTEPK